MLALYIWRIYCFIILESWVCFHDNSVSPLFFSSVSSGIPTVFSGICYISLSDRNPLSRIPVACLSVMAFSGFVLYNFVTGIPYQEFLLHAHISNWYSRSLEVTFFYPAKHVIFCEWKGRLVMMTMIGWNKFTNVYSRKKIWLRKLYQNAITIQTTKLRNKDRFLYKQVSLKKQKYFRDLTTVPKQCWPPGV